MSNAGYDRGSVRQPDVSGILREHRQRLRALEMINPPGQATGAALWTDISAQISITVETVAAPPIQSAAGFRLDIPVSNFGGAGVLVNQTLAWFRIVIDGAAGGGGYAWKVDGVLDASWDYVGLSEATLGTGRLVHMGDDGAGGFVRPYIAYPVWYQGHNGTELRMVTEGIEPGPGRVPASDPVAFVRDDWPCATLGKNDVIEGFIQAMSEFQEL